MPPKEPNRHQLSSRLSYSQETPAFLQKLKNRIAGIPDDDEDDEFEDDGSGRPPIPRRPAIPERPASQPGSDDEDNADEKPQVVVLREGKHLTEREAENIRRKERGLPPLPEPEGPTTDIPAKEKKDKPTPSTTSLSFSSSSTKPPPKRKRIVTTTADDDAPSPSQVPSKKKKKTKKNATLLSFGDDA